MKILISLITSFIKRISSRSNSIVFLILWLFACNAYAHFTATPSTSTDGSYTLSWPNDGLQPELYEKFNNGGYVKISPTRSFSGKANGTYKYMLKRYSPWHNNQLVETKYVTVKVNKPPQAPSVPSGLNTPSSNSSGSFNITWNASSGTVTKYQLQRNGSTIQSNTSRSRSESGLGNGTYSYRVRACNGNVCSAWSGVKATTVNLPPTAPSTPSGLGVPANDTDGSFSVNWNASTGTVTKYELARNNSIIQSSGSRSRNESNLSNGSYAYKVRACNGSACSGWSAAKSITVTLPPSLPAGLNAPATDIDGRFTVSWNAASGTVTKYQLQRNNSTIQNSSSLSRNESGLGNGSYTYRVRACNVSACSAWSSNKTTRVILPPSIPSGLSSPASDSDGSYSITWGASTGSVNRYELQRNSTTIQNNTSRSFNEQGLPNGAYTYRVRACNGNVCSGWSSNITSQVNRPAGTFTANPSHSTDGSYTLFWPNDGLSAELYEKVNNGSYQKINTTRNFSGKPNGTYTYMLKRYSPWHNGALVETQYTTVTVNLTVQSPTIPSGLSTPNNDEDGSFSVTWNESSGTITHYELQRNSATIHNDINRSVAEQGLPNGHYRYRVRACNTDACSGWSAEVTTQVTWPSGTFTATPTTSTDGAYTLWWPNDGLTPELYEKVNDGSYVLIQTTRNFSGKENGVYTYKLIRYSPWHNGAPVDTQVVSVTVELEPQAPSIPSGLSAPANDDDGSFTVNWNASQGTVTRYELQRNNLTVYNDGSRSYEEKDLPNGLYVYRVKACNDSLCSAWSEEINVNVDNPLVTPTMPERLAAPATDDDGTFVVSWDESIGIVTAYQLDINGQVVTANKLNYPQTGLLPGSYTYKVKACNGLDLCSAWTEPVITIVDYLTVPNFINVHSVPDSDAHHITWGASLGTVDRYELEESVDDGAWTSIYSGLDLEYTTTARNLTSVYQYKVRACNGSKCTDYVLSDIFAGDIPVLVAPTIIMSKPVNEAGDYELLLEHDSVHQSHRYDLFERNKGDVEWSEDPIVRFDHTTTQPFIFQVTNKPDGVYEYVARTCSIVEVECSELSATLSVAVGVGQLNPVPAPAEIPAIDHLLNEHETIGATAGQFRVDESGSATYSIPIMAPKGIAGVTPEISLNYTSQSSNGFLGQGWSIGGLSAITRCRQTLGQDGQPLPIQWNNDDRFCFNGARLISDDPTQSDYGAVNSTYKTEIDAFSKITYLGDAFKVESKDGSVSFFGNDTGSKLTTVSGTLTWMINRFEDNMGNAIIFHYLSDGGHRIDKILYAADQSQIKFNYDINDRYDAYTRYIAGAPLTTTKRLASIDVSNSGQSLRHYKLEYLPSVQSPKMSKLRSVTECVSATGVCLRPTTFSWTHSAQGFEGGTIQDSFVTEDQEGLVDFKPADINGDGFMDIVWLEADLLSAGAEVEFTLRYLINTKTITGERKFTKKGFWQNNSKINQLRLINEKVHERPSVKVKIIDFNGDGRQDVAVLRAFNAIGEWEVYLSTPILGQGWELSAEPITLGINEYNIEFGDVNGDGLVDAYSGRRVWLLQEKSSVTDYRLPYEYVAQPDIDLSSALAQMEFRYDVPVPDDDVEKAFYYRLTHQPDFNGDGIPDYIYSQDWYEYIDTSAGRMVLAEGRISYVLLTQPDGDFNVIPLQVPEKVLSPKSSRSADLNGDGLPDLIIYYKTSPGTQVPNDNKRYIRLNNGFGFEPPVLIDNAPTTQHTLLDVTDIDNDGYPDFVYQDYINQKISYLPWTGNNFGESENLFFAAAPSENNNYKVASHFFIDVSGDGFVDYIKFFEQRLDIELATPIAEGESMNTVHRIDNGMGNITEIQYHKLNQTDHYSQKHIDQLPLPIDKGDPFKECIPRVYADGECSLKRNYPYTIADVDTYYRKLYEAWEISEGNHTLGKLAPVIDFMAPASVVTQVSSSAPTASDRNARSSVSYFYGEAKLQAAGRGFLGFHKIKTRDEQTGIETTTTYRQDFPFIGVPLKTEVYNGEQLLRYTANEWKLAGITDAEVTDLAVTAKNNGSVALGSLRPYLASATESVYDLNTADLELTNVTTANKYDTFGNAEEIVVTTKDGNHTYVKATINSYDSSGYGDSDYARRMGRLSHVSVTTEAYGEINTRESAFNYYTSGVHKGLLKEEIIEPESPELRLVKAYEYDNYGNTTRVTQSTANMTDRFALNVYGDDGRYLESSKNSKGHVVNRILTRNHYGDPTLVENSDGLQSTIQYDAFGRKVLDYNQTGAYSYTLLSANDANYCPSATQSIATTYSAGGSRTKVCYDLLGRTLRKAVQGFDGQWVFTNIEYDNRGRVVRQSEPFAENDPVYWTTMEYDLLGRVTKQTSPDNVVTEMVYDALSSTITTDVGGKNLSNTETKNALGQLVEVVDNNGGRIAYRYDLEGQLRFVNQYGSPSDPHNLQTEIRYDALGRKIWMNDPDKGIWNYYYNGFGELILQVDANNQASVMHYDQLGRMVSRLDYQAQVTRPTTIGQITGTLENNSRWAYDNDAGRVLPGKLLSVEDNTNDYRKVLSYDRFGRASNIALDLGLGAVDGQYDTKTTYDQYGRVFQQFDAAGDNTFSSNATQNIYNEFGYLEKVVDAEFVSGVSKKIYQEILDMDARGKITRYRQGNQVLTQQRYDNASGRLVQLLATDSLSQRLQDLTYTWDNLGNLSSRADNLNSLTEVFTYDSLNRLTEYGIGSQRQSVSYDALGNILTKSDVGNGQYRYGSECGSSSAKPHAVCSTPDGVIYTYDANGNMLSDTVGTDAANNSVGGRTITYSSFNKPIHIVKGNHATSFFYGPDRARYKRVDVNSADNTQKVTLYLGRVEKIIQNNEYTLKRYLPGGAIETKTYSIDPHDVAISERANILLTQPEKTHTRYTLKDHLGSVDVITDNLGSEVQRLSFDPWGKRRSGEDWQAKSIEELLAPSQGLMMLSVKDTTTRGFTGHEMVDEVGLIHMNGRIYDARIARFVQADSIIDGVADTQGYNRYAYVRNNPLNATDPSGYSRKAQNIFKLFQLVFTAIATYACGTECGAGAYKALAFVGFSTTMVMTRGDWKASLRAGVMAGLNAYTFGSLGDYGFVGNILAQGTVGGFMAVLQGDKFGHGFISAGVGAAFGGGGLIQRMIVGGVVSELTGGKFKNGAVSAAFKWAVGAGVALLSKPDQDLKVEVENELNDGQKDRNIFGRIFKRAVSFLIGENYGAAWRSLFTEKWVRGPTGGMLPESLASDLRDVGRKVPSDAANNGMHAWHAGSNALMAKKFGLLGAPLIFLAGVYHETPLDWESFKAEQEYQGTVNHFLDSVTDIGANIFGMLVGYSGGSVDQAIRWGNQIPGPGETDPAFGGGGPYNGRPSDAWGH